MDGCWTATGLQEVAQDDQESFAHSCGLPGSAGKLQDALASSCCLEESCRFQCKILFHLHEIPSTVPILNGCGHQH